MPMGQVTIPIRVSNWLDVEKVALGERAEPPRTVNTVALVDTGAVKFHLKASLIRELGLRRGGEVTSRTMANIGVQRQVFSLAELEVQGRSGRLSVVEVSDDSPNRVGRIPLADLDWVVDLRNRKLIPNPEHKNGELCDDF
jgi:hypothetical protein